MEKTIMLYTDSFMGTTGYSNVARAIATRLVQRGWRVYYQEHSTQHPIFKRDGIHVIPAMVERNDQRLSTILMNNIEQIKPDFFMPISDPCLMLADGIQHFIHKVSSKTKFVPYTLVDGHNPHDGSEAIFNKASKILTASMFGQKEINAMGYTAEVLYHGVDFHVFYPPASLEEKRAKRNAYQLPLNKHIFLTVGRNSRRKKHPRLLEAIAHFNRMRPDNNAYFLLHIGEHRKNGWNLEILRQRLEYRYKCSMNNVVFTDEHRIIQGAQRSVVADYFQAADTYITASSGEGFGLPIIEAMASGLPVIAPENSSHIELLKDGRGYLVENEGFIYAGYGTTHPLVDITALSEQIQQLNDRGIDESVAHNAFSFVKEYCDWGKIATKLEYILSNQKHRDG